ncbi:: hypothetical protein [Arcticibacter svalbardensis MN12-7]|uniref:SusD/RagB family nutrient-binding outer membrane lipoprotein n=2 Tax=Arcticibacter TaxID=1288026 RepID=R9GW38_9SPHI|nr:: hypothetical protein [Arcticibacter svalbardensis MN12-7]
MDEVNKDVNHTTDAKAKYVLTDVITRTAFSNAGGEANTYASAYVEHEVGTHGQLWDAEHRISQPSSSSTYNNTWGSLYTSLKDAKVVISKCSEGGTEAGNDVTKGMAEVMAAYNLALITDLYGDAPYLEAGDYSVSLTPKVDKQEVIYQAILAYINSAIVDLQKTDSNLSGGPGSNDLLYSGNKAKWLKFAHGLKARYTMRLIKKSTKVNADLQTVIDEVNQSFASVTDQAAFGIYDENNINPTFDFQWSRDDLAASRSMVDKLIERNDPRLRRDFIDADWVQVAAVTTGDDAYELMAINGANDEAQYVYNTSVFMFSQTAPTLLLSYHEILFLKAEAMSRLGQSSAAIASILKEAVVAAIANSEISVEAGLHAPTVGDLEETSAAINPTEAASYFDTSVLPLFLANPLKEIMNQKYISFFGASGESVEAYNDIRRLKGLGENLIVLKNAGKFPLRFTYGSDDTTTNPNIQAIFGDGQYAYTEAVWWAGGTR